MSLLAQKTCKPNNRHSQMGAVFRSTCRSVGVITLDYEFMAYLATIVECARGIKRISRAQYLLAYLAKTIKGPV